MKPTTTNVQAVSSGIGQAEVMGIDPDGMATVLSILSNMYADGELAVVREYASNARDSHVEAGNPDPILITSPTHFNPVFSVQDFGTGLSRDEVLNVFAKYGASTKRATDEMIGSFGIGAKSAFTVGTQFTVTAVKDGMQTVALFALDANGAPTVNIIAHICTLEPDGVKVDVGVRNVQGVNNAIAKLFPTWPSGSVLVDGEEPASIWDQMPSLSDSIHMTWRENAYDVENPAWTVVMGGVPYEVQAPLISALEGRPRQIAQNVAGSRARVYMTVPIGAVDITPSREELRVTAKTVDAVSAGMLDFRTLIPGWVSDQIASAKSRIEAIIKLREFKKNLGHLAHDTLANVTWHGKQVDGGTLSFSNAEFFILTHGRSYYGKKTAKRYKGLEINSHEPVEKFLFVTDVPDRRMRSVQLAAKPYLSHDGRDRMSRVVGFYAGPPIVQDWFDISDPALTVMTFNDFIAQWKPATTPGQKSSVMYEVMGDQSKWAPDDLNDMGDVFYLTHHEWMRTSQNSPFLADAVDGNPVVILKATQKPEALIKRVPAAKSARAAMRDAAGKLLRGIGKDDANAIAAQKFLSSIDNQIIAFLLQVEAKITNAEVLSLLENYRSALDLTKHGSARLEKLQMAAKIMDTGLNVTIKSDIDTDQFKTVMARLPLLAIYLSRAWSRTELANEHAVLYTNMVSNG